VQTKEQNGLQTLIFSLGLLFSVLLVTPYSTMDPINLPKMVVLVLFSFTWLGLIFGYFRLSEFRQNRLLGALLAGFVLDAFLVLLFSGRVFSESIYGISGRNTGFITYISLAIFMYGAALNSSEKFLARFRVIFLSIGAILLIYGFIQFVGLEPFPYVNIYANNVFGTFGNPNFQSAFMGIFGAFALSSAFEIKKGGAYRAALVVLFMASIFGIYSTNSWQGFFNLAAGISFACILLLFRSQKILLAKLLVGLSIFGTLIVSLGILNIGPLASILSKASLEARRLYWEAAIRLLGQHPFLGVGLDGYGDWYRRGRSIEAAQNNSGLISDSAHSVPLDIASGGGFPLLLIYLALIFLTVASIVKVVRHNTNLTIGFIAVTSAWVSYQAQSLISINQIGLGVIGWTLGGLIIGYSNLPTDSESKINLKNPSKLKGSNSQSISISSFFGPLVGLLVGALIALPPYISANKFYEGLKSSDARVINSNAYLRPLEVRRMLVAANLLEKNRFFKESLEIARSATKSFPDSYQAWVLLGSLTNAGLADKAKVNTELHRLDPNLKLYLFSHVAHR